MNKAQQEKKWNKPVNKGTEQMKEALALWILREKTGFHA